LRPQRRRPARGTSGAVFGAPAFVAGFDDVAVMGETVEQRGRHLGVAEDAGPLPESEIGCHDNGGALIEPADEVEKELAVRLREGQIAEFGETDEVHAGDAGARATGSTR